MIIQKLRKVGNSYVVTVPKAEVERKQLREGDFVSLEVNRLDVRLPMRPALRQALEENWQRDEAAYRYLAT